MALYFFFQNTVYLLCLILLLDNNFWAIIFQLCIPSDLCDGKYRRFTQKFIEQSICVVNKLQLLAETQYFKIIH